MFASRWHALPTGQLIRFGRRISRAPLTTLPKVCRAPSCRRKALRLPRRRQARLARPRAVGGLLQNIASDLTTGRPTNSWSPTTAAGGSLKTSRSMGRTQGPPPQRRSERCGRPSGHRQQPCERAARLDVAVRCVRRSIDSCGLACSFAPSEQPSTWTLVPPLRGLVRDSSFKSTIFQ